MKDLLKKYNVERLEDLSIEQFINLMKEVENFRICFEMIENKR